MILRGASVILGKVLLVLCEHVLAEAHPLMDQRMRARPSTQTKTSTGSKDTEAKALAVIPCTWPPLPATVITVTPVAN